MKKIFTCLALLFSVCFGFNSCEPDVGLNNDVLFGTWRTSWNKSETKGHDSGWIMMMFKRDGTGYESGSIQVYESDGSKNGEADTWKENFEYEVTEYNEETKTGKVTIIYEGKSSGNTYDFQIVEGGMYLSGEYYKKMA